MHSLASGDGPRRAHLLDLLDRIEPVDADEAAQRDFARRWVGGGAPLYRTRKPDVPKTHLVSYFVVVDPRHGELLLVDHRGAGLWLPTGGHVEQGDADPWATVQRECPEELWIEAEPLAATGTTPFLVTVARTRGAGSHTDVSLWYVVQATAADVTRYDDREFAGIAWVPPPQIMEAPPGSLGPHVQRAVGKLSGLLGLRPAG